MSDTDPADLLTQLASKVRLAAFGDLELPEVIAWMNAEGI